ncbi:dolichyl-diphosphooligosaccharide--protein glycosyltransferase 48 kda subunit, partial [Quercus suber]
MARATMLKHPSKNQNEKLLSGLYGNFDIRLPAKVNRQGSTAATEARAPNKLVCNRIDGIFQVEEMARFFRSEVQKAGSPTRHEKSGKEQFWTELSKWAFHERGHLKSLTVT